MAPKRNNLFPFNDIIVGLCFLIFCVFFYFKSVNLSDDAKIFPLLILFCLTSCSLGLFITSIRQVYLSKTKEKQKIIQNSKPRKRLFTIEEFRSEFFAIIFFLLVVVYIIFLPLIGFEYSSIIFMVAGMWLVNKKQLKRNYYVAILIPLIFTLLLRVLLNVSLPASNIPFISF